MLENFTAYIKQIWKDKPDKSTPLSADRLNHIENGIKSNSDYIEEIKEGLLDAIYPVGSIYMSVNSTSPKEIWGAMGTDQGSIYIIGR